MPASQPGQRTATIWNAPVPIERRERWLMQVPEHPKRAIKYWTDLQIIAMVRRTRQVCEKTSDEIHYYLSSLPLSAGARRAATGAYLAIPNCST